MERTTETQVNEGLEETRYASNGGNGGKTGGLNVSPRAKQMIIIAAIVAIVAIAGLWYYYAGRVSTDDAEIAAHIDPISPRVGGTIIAIEVVNNQHVQAGQILFQIDPTDYKVALERAQANYAAAQAGAQEAEVGVPITSTTSGSQLSSAGAGVGDARANLSAAEKGVVVANAELASANARLQAAQANATKSSRDLTRYGELVAKDEVSRQQYDATVARAAADKASVASAQAQVEAAQQDVMMSRIRVKQSRYAVVQAQARARAAGTAPEQVAAMRAKAAAALAYVRQAKAALDQAELNLGYTTVRAPVEGVISKKSAEIGQVVAPGQPLLAIVPLKDVWVEANFKETQLRNVRKGQKAIIHVDTYGRDYSGYVESIAAGTGSVFSLLPPENATGNYVKVVQRIPVKIFFDHGQNTKRLLRAGMSVEATILTR